MSQQHHTPPLQSGATLTVVTGDETRGVAIDRVAQGLIWVSTGEIGPLQPGEEIEVEIGIKGDARYRTPARVAIAMSGFVGLRIEDRWDRRQLREYVRINTYGFRIEMAPQDDDGLPTLSDVPLIDFSAGGARVAEEKKLEVGDVVKCRFPLGEAEFNLVAEVVRVSPATAAERRFVSLEFHSVDEGMRGDLIGWVNQEQLRRRTQVRERSRGSRHSS